MAAELLARPVEGDAAHLEHVRVPGGVEGEVRVLLDDEHREPLLLVQLVHDAEDLARYERREPEGGLVEQDQAGAGHQGARERAIQAGGVYSLNAQLSKLPAFCPVWRVPVATAAERQPVTASIPTLLMSGGYDLMVVVEGPTLHEVAGFVSEKLSTQKGVTSTATHFRLRAYKENGVELKKESGPERLSVAP